MHRQWVNEIQNLLERYKHGDYAVLPDGESLREEVPSPLKALLYFYLTSFALMTGDIEKSENYASQARASFDTESQYIDNSSLVVAEVLPAFYQGKFKDSLARLNLRGQHHQLQYLRAECYYWQGKFAEAIPIYQEAFALCEDDRNLEEDAKLCLLGESRCYFRQEEPDKAEEFFKILCEDLPQPLNDECEDSSIFFAGELARVYVMQKKFPQARRMAGMLDPTNFRHPYRRAFALFIHAYFHYSQKELELAHQNLQEVVALPIRTFDKLESLLMLGNLYQQQAEHQDAYNYFLQVMEFPEIFLAKEAEKQIAILPETKKMARPIQPQPETVSAKPPAPATAEALPAQAASEPAPEPKRELSIEERAITNAICGTGQKKLVPMAAKLRIDLESVSAVKAPDLVEVAAKPQAAAISEPSDREATPAASEPPTPPASLVEVAAKPQAAAISEPSDREATPAASEPPTPPASLVEVAAKPQAAAISEPSDREATPAASEPPTPPASDEAPQLIIDDEPEVAVAEASAPAIAETPELETQVVVVKELEPQPQPEVCQAPASSVEIVPQAPEAELTSENIWQEMPITSILLGLDLLEKQMRSKVGQ